MTSKQKSAKPQGVSPSEKKAKHRAHFAWQETLAARTDISPVLKLVAWALALYRNVENGRCDPSYAGLAARAGVSESSAKRAIALFERLGLIAVTRTRGGAEDERNSYRPLMPKGVSMQTPLRGVRVDTPRGVRERAEGCQCGHTNMMNTKKTLCGRAKALPTERERESAACAAFSSPPGEVGAVAPSPGEEGKQASEIEIIPPGAFSLNQERAWRELRELWQRPHAENQRADREAFNRACQEVTPEIILAAAPAWLEAYEPRFRQPLWKWLGDRGWEKDPPQRKERQRRKRANGTAHPKTKRKSAALWLLEDAGYVLDDDGEIVGEAS